MRATSAITCSSFFREVHDRTDEDRAVIRERVALYRERDAAGLDVITGLPRARTPTCGHPSEERTRHADGKERCRACNRERGRRERQA